MKKGQTTLFIVLGIVIVAIIALTVTFQEELSTKAGELGIITEAQLEPEFQNKKEQVEECLSELLEISTYNAAVHGGYAAEAPTGSFVLGELPIAYYLNEGKKRAPTYEIVAKEIAILMRQDATLCATVIDEEAKDSRVTVEIEEEKLTAEIEMPIQLVSGERKETIKTFNAESKLSLGKLLTAGQEIAQTQEDASELCLSCINEIALEHGIKAELKSLQGSIIVKLIDENSEIDGDPLKLNFAVK